jgi:1D-myo-inositol 3-kinase
MLDYLAVGHVTQDQWPEGPTPGGTVTYASRTARAFVQRVGVLTAAAPDLDVALTFPDIEVTRLDTAITTQFQNVYSASGRLQIVLPCPITLMPNHLTDAMRRSRIAHLAPVCNEINADVSAAFSASTFIGITPQGWMRRWDAQGHVTSRASNWVDAPFVLARASAVVISIDDVAGDWDMACAWAAQTKLLVVTQGALGCTAYTGGMTLHVPAPVVHEAEPTGAGDVFAATLFVALQRGDSLQDACALANCIAAQSVTRPRLNGIPTSADIALCSN